MATQASEKIRNGEFLTTLQVLRGVAATLVVFVHAVRALTIYRPPDLSFALPLLFSAQYFRIIGGIGVDIFFVISGFIMIHVSRGYIGGFASAADFMIRRLIRIYPMYFLVTLGVCLIYTYYTLAKGAAPDFDLKPDRILSSLLFFPTYDSQHEVAPIVGVGWTLFYEMYFYICFAFALFFARNMISYFLLAMVGGVIVVSLLIPGDAAVLRFFQNTIVLEFIFGCLLGALFESGNFPKWNPLVLIVPALVASVFLPDFPGDAYRFLTWGVTATFIVSATLCFEARGGYLWSKKWLIFGDASYTIYLVHMVVIYNVLYRLLLKVHHSFDSRLLTDGLIILFTGASITVGIVLYLAFEAPIRREFKKKYRGIEFALEVPRLAVDNYYNEPVEGKLSAAPPPGGGRGNNFP